MVDILPQEKDGRIFKNKKTHNNVYLSCKSVLKVKTKYVLFDTYTYKIYIGKSLSTPTKDKIQNAKR